MHLIYEIEECGCCNVNNALQFMKLVCIVIEEKQTQSNL